MKLAAAPLLLLLACVGTAHAQGLLGSRLSTLRCGGVTPAPIPSAVLKAVGVNGAIEISWPPALCADKFAVTVTRTDLAETNVLRFVVAGTSAVADNVANGSKYTVRVVPCNGALCSTVPAEVAGVTPRGDVAPTLKTYEADGQGVAPAVVAPATPTATPTGWRVAPTAGATIKYKPRTRAFQMTPAAKKA